MFITGTLARDPNLRLNVPLKEKNWATATDVNNFVTFLWKDDNYSYEDPDRRLKLHL